MSEEFYIHRIYEHGLSGYGMVFDCEGNFKYAVPPLFFSDKMKRDRLSNSITIRDNDRIFHIIDPAIETEFEDEQKKRAIDNFNRYFNRVFLENSPLIDTYEEMGTKIEKITKSIDITGKVLDIGAGNQTYSHLFDEYIAFDLIPVLTEKKNFISLV